MLCKNVIVLHSLQHDNSSSCLTALLRTYAKRDIFWGQKPLHSGGKVENWGGICPPVCMLKRPWHAPSNIRTFYQGLKRCRSLTYWVGWTACLVNYGITIHQHDLQLLIIEIFKTKNDLNPTFMKNILTE